MLKACRSRISRRRVGTELLELQGMRNEMIVSSFIYVSFRRAVNAQVSNDAPVLRF